MAWVIYHPYMHTNQITSNTEKTLSLSSSALPMSPLLCPPKYTSSAVVHGAGNALMVPTPGTGLQPPKISTILILTKVVTLSLSSPTSAPTPEITHPKPKSACTSSTAGRWAACHSQITPHQTDTREDKNNWLAGKCLVQSWMNDSATLEQKEECLPTQADKCFVLSRSETVY